MNSLVFADDKDLQQNHSWPILVEHPCHLQ